MKLTFTVVEFCGDDSIELFNGRSTTATLVVEFSGTGLPFMLQTRSHFMFMELTHSYLSSNFTGVFVSIKVSFHDILVKELVQ